MSYLVCVPASQRAYFADDELGDCCKCGAPVRFRPYAPAEAERICMSCAVPMMKELVLLGRASQVTPKALAEVDLFFARGGKA